MKLQEDPESYEEALRSRFSLVPYRDWDYRTKDDFDDPNKGFSYETYSGSQGSLENVGVIDSKLDDYAQYTDNYDFSHAALKSRHHVDNDQRYVTSAMKNQLKSTSITNLYGYESAENGGGHRSVSMNNNWISSCSPPAHYHYHHHHPYQHRPATARELPPNPLDPKNYKLYGKYRTSTRPASAPPPNYNPQPHHISKVFNFNPQSTKVPEEWGTGKLKDKSENIWAPKAATFTYREIPIQQSYELTKLKKSNLRTSDQLLPDPKDSRMDLLMIDRPFPAEHPYTSHIPRVAMFPKFAETPEDPKRGVDARRLVPKDAEMPASAHNVTIVHKTKGQGDRHEIQELPSESHKRALTWPEPEFNQLVKSVNGGRQQYYPTPIKYLVPNLEKRRPDQQISQRTANALRNVERSQWKTTYDLENTGHGPSNPLALDNYSEKMEKFYATGDIDDELYARSVPTFDPARPMEGRIARQIMQRPSPQVNPDEHGDRYTWDPSYKRKMTLREKEEHRLLNGTAYKSLPIDLNDPKYTSQQWLAMEKQLHPDAQRELMKEKRTADESYGGRIGDEKTTTTTNGMKNPLNEMRSQEKDRIQQMEASNRWKLLDLQKPSHDIQALNEKYKSATDKERAEVFYKHEGNFQAERAGMYQTSYLPEKLSARLDDVYNTGPGPKMFDTSDSHVDAIDQPSALSAGMNVVNSFNEMNLYNEPNSLISGRLEPSQVLTPLAKQTYLQKQKLTPDVTSADVKAQERELINTESTHGSSYSKPKFLQEYTIHPFARHEPLVVMSNVNQSLQNVKAHASTRRPKTVQFSENVTIATGAGDEPIRLSSAPMNGSSQPVSEVQYTSTQAKFDPRNTLNDAELYDTKQSEPTVTKFNGTWPMPSLRGGKPNEQQSQRKSRVRGSYDNSVVQDQFAESRGKAIIPDSRNEFRTAYQAQFGNYDLSFKDGKPRPLKSLLDIQNSFSKTKALHKFHNTFTEGNPDLRDNIIKGRQHEFSGYNTMQLRGNGGPIEVA